MKKTLRLTLGLALAAFFLWLIFRRLDLNELPAAFSKPDPLLAALALLSLGLGYSCRIERWRLLLLHENPALRWQHCAGPLLAGFAANNVLPLRLGDLLRAIGFKRHLGIGAATALASLLVERLLDLLLLLCFLGLALLGFGLESSNLLGVGGGFLLLAGLVILPVLLSPSVFKPAARWGAGLIAAAMPKPGGMLLLQCEKIFAALEHAARGHTMPKLLLWSLLAWTAEGCVFWLIALALPSIAIAAAAWLALPAATLATLLPGAPGHVGAFDYFTMQAMLLPGNPVAASAAYAFLVHAVLWLPVSLAGGLYLLRKA